jgi:hypothetical protein
MSTDPVRRFERMVDRAARRLTGSGLHPIEILERVASTIEEGVRDGFAPNEVRIGLHPDDYRAYRTALPGLRGEVETLMADLEERKGYRRIGDVRVLFEQDTGAAPAAPAIEARFADTRSRVEPQAGAATRTRRIVRHKGLRLLLSDGTRVPVTHTPFRLGRGPGNDLVLPSMAVSRDHAEIVRTADGFAIRDLGSRNGLVVEGERLQHTIFRPGVPVRLGDVDLWLEVGP